MSEKPMVQNTPRADTDAQLRLFRERMAAVIASVIIVCSFVLIGVAFSFVGDAERFGRVKDLLLFVNPILGVAIGYFFNKVTSDARSEVAESSARQATVLRDAAMAEKEAMRSETAQMKTALEELTTCAGEMLAQPEGAPPSGPGKLGVPADTAAASEAWKARLALEAAVKRAQKWLGKG